MTNLVIDFGAAFLRATTHEKSTTVVQPEWLS